MTAKHAADFQATSDRPCCDYRCNQGRNCPVRHETTTELRVLRAAQYGAVTIFIVCWVGFMVWVIK